MTHNPAEALREALARHDVQAEAAGSCLDGYCVVKRPQGQHTNGGCRCSTDRMKASRMMMAGQALANAVRAALASPAPAGGEADPTPLKLVYDKGRRTIVLEMKGARYTLTKITDAPAASPPPSPDVAGVVDADLIERVSGRLKQRAHNREQLEGIKASHAIEHVAATLLESLSAEKGRLVGLVKDLDDALCAAQEKLQGNPLVLKWVIEIIGDARARARTALTPKEKA